MQNKQQKGKGQTFRQQVHNAMRKKGFWTMKQWAEQHGYNQIEVGVVITRWGEKEGTPRGKTAQIYYDLLKLINN